MRGISRQVLPVLFLATILTLAACQGQVAPSPLSASLSELQGTVGIKPPDGNQFNPAKSDSVLAENGEVQTGDDGRVRLDLSTGTIIRMAPASLFTLASNAPANQSLATRLKMEVGRIFIILQGGNMDVETPSGVASVRGSFMMVEVNSVSNDTLVTCLEGHCEASNPAGKVQFTAGQKTTLLHRDPATGQYIAPGVEPMNAEDFQKWLDGNPEAQQWVEKAIAAQTAQPEKSTQAPLALEPVKPTATVTTAPTLVTVVPSAEASACLKLVSPSADTTLPNNGTVNFQWESNVQAAKYVVTFTLPDGTLVPFESTHTSLERFIGALPANGNYSWQVTALDTSGNEICRSESISFTKPAPEPTRVKEPDFVCTVGQWQDPNLPCYCDESSPNLPPYCFSGN